MSTTNSIAKYDLPWFVVNKNHTGSTRMNRVNSSYIASGPIGGWELKMAVTSPDGKIYGVGTGDNVGIWNETGNGWHDQGLLGGWRLKMLAFNATGTMWCVNTDGKVGKWNGTGWDLEAKYTDGSHKLNMLTFDAEDTMWRVDEDGFIASWDGAAWIDHSYGDWRLHMLAFSASGAKWCVGKGNNVGYLPEGTEHWQDLGLSYSGQEALWLDFTINPYNAD